MILRHAGFLFFPAIAALSIGGCDTNPSSPPFGNMELTTSAPALAGDIATADGWTVKFDRFLVHVTAVEVASADGVVAAYAENQIIDQVAPGPKSLLSETLRTAREWEAVSLQIGPAMPDAEITLIEPASADDQRVMQEQGLSVLVTGKASKAGVVKTFTWGFTTDTLYSQCEDDRGGQMVRGLVLPPNGSDAADFLMSGEGLFLDSLVDPGTLRADAIAAADANNDNIVTLDELRAVSLDDARTSGGAYAVEEGSPIADLGAFVEGRVRGLVTRFRSAGTCTAEPVVAEEEVAEEEEE